MENKCSGSELELASTVARGQSVICQDCGRKLRAQLSTAGCAVPPHTAERFTSDRRQAILNDLMAHFAATPAARAALLHPLAQDANIAKGIRQ